jgi:hypothetical protein
MERLLLYYISFPAKCCQASTTYISALHTPKYHFISVLRRVSLAEYILVLKVYSLLLQITCFIRVTASTVSTQRVTKTRSWA